MEINNFNNKIAQAFTSVHHKQFNQEPKVIAFNINDVEVITNKLKALILFNNSAVEKGKYGCSVEVTNTARLDQTCVKVTCTVYDIIKSSGMQNVFALAAAFQFDQYTNEQINKL